MCCFRLHLSCSTHIFPPFYPITYLIMELAFRGCHREISRADKLLGTASITFLRESFRDRARHPLIIIV